MGTKAFSLYSQANYRTGGHFLRESRHPRLSLSFSLSLANQEIMVDDRESHFKAMFPDIFADFQNPPLPGHVTMTKKAWQIWKKHSQFNFALWCASAGCGVCFEDHLKRRRPFLPACTASTSTIRPGALSSSQGINLIHGTRMHMTPEPESSFVLSSPFLRNKTGGRRWITDVKVSDLGVPS